MIMTEMMENAKSVLKTVQNTLTRADVHNNVYTTITARNQL